MEAVVGINIVAGKSSKNCSLCSLEFSEPHMFFRAAPACTEVSSRLEELKSSH